MSILANLRNNSISFSLISLLGTPLILYFIALLFFGAQTLLVLNDSKLFLSISFSASCHLKLFQATLTTETIINALIVTVLTMVRIVIPVAFNFTPERKETLDLLKIIVLLAIIVLIKTVNVSLLGEASTNNVDVMICTDSDDPILTEALQTFQPLYIMNIMILQVSFFSLYCYMDKENL